MAKDIFIGKADARIIGSEPKWDASANYSNTDIRLAYNWYNYVLDDKDKAKIVSEYVTDKKEAQRIRSLSAGLIPSRVAGMIRMSQRGYVMNDTQVEKLASDIRSLVELGTSKKDPARPSVSVKERATVSAGKYIADIEDRLDEFYNKGYKSDFKAYTWLSQVGMKPMLAIAVADYYQSLLDELNDAKDGYGHLTKAELKRYKAFVGDIIKDCHTWAKNTKKQTVRKPRKKKEVTTDKLVSKVQYQRKDDDLQLASVDPAKIIGASAVWLYNSKYRMLQYYTATDRGGLTIKGTTLQNFHEEASIQKKIRKPEIVKNFVERGPKAVLKDFASLKVKPSVCSGRINANTIILRIIK